MATVIDEPVMIPEDSDVMYEPEDEDEEELVEEERPKKSSRIWSMILGGLFLILIIFLALWLWSLYKAQKQQQALHNLGTGIAQLWHGKATGNKAAVVAVPSSSTSVPGMMIENPTH